MSDLAETVFQKQEERCQVMGVEGVVSSKNNGSNYSPSTWFAASLPTYISHLPSLPQLVGWELKRKLNTHSLPATPVCQPSPLGLLCDSHHYLGRCLLSSRGPRLGGKGGSDQGWGEWEWRQSCPGCRAGQHEGAVSRSPRPVPTCCRICRRMWRFLRTHAALL